MTAPAHGIVMITLVSASLTAQVPPHWSLVASTGPTARSDHAMAYDSARGRAVLFGGSAGRVLGDTWEWDGINWLPQVFASGPSSRANPAMVFDSNRSRTVLFGGHDSNTALQDTWEWDGSTWTLRATTGPSARLSHAMAYDSHRNRTVLFGGHDGTGVVLSDTWEWDGSTWTARASGGPSGRNAHAMAFDSQRGRTVMFGAGLGDTWEWDGNAWMDVSSNTPGRRTFPAMAYDSHHGRTVLFGGEAGGAQLPSDTWEWDGSVWTRPATQGPSGRRQPEMVYDSQRGRTLMFGGVDVLTHHGDTWEWNSGFTGVATVYGAGCGNPALNLTPASQPTINTTVQALLTNMPSSLAFVALGWSRESFGLFQLPLTLAGFGMPGCDLLQSAEASALPTTPTGPGTASFGMQLPDIPGLVGLRVYLQAWAFAPGVNPGHTVVSNGIEWGIGNG